MSICLCFPGLAGSALNNFCNGHPSGPGKVTTTGSCTSRPLIFKMSLSISASKDLIHISLPRFLFFESISGSQNLCVASDDRQALSIQLFQNRSCFLQQLLFRFSHSILSFLYWLTIIGDHVAIVIGRGLCPVSALFIKLFQ